MPADIYWIGPVAAGKVAILARPRPGDWLEDEISDWRRLEVHVVVSLLEPSEALHLGLETEAELCIASGIDFVSFPIPDVQVPVSEAPLQALVTGLLTHLEGGRNVGIHCRGGVGRSAVIAACLLVAAGTSPEEALNAISIARGVGVPETDAQRAYVMSFRR